MPKISVARREQMYEALLDAVTDLVVDRGYEAVTMSAIAERAGLARTAIYNYAEDKAALLVAAAERGSEPMRKAIGKVAEDTTVRPPGRLDRILQLALGSFSRDTQNLLILRAVKHSLAPAARDGALHPFRRDVGEHLARVLRDGIAAGDYRPDHDSAFTLELMTGVLAVAIDSVLEHPSTAASVIDATRSFLHGALRPDPQLIPYLDASE